MKYLFTICGRAGSKGYRNKNLKHFLDIPLVYYTLSAINLAKTELEKKGDSCYVILNTDSEELIELVSKQRVLMLNQLFAQKIYPAISYQKFL